MRLLSGTRRGARWAVLAGGATSAMVALLIAPAFACTAQGNISVMTPGSGPVGTPFRFEVTFAPDPGSEGDQKDIVIMWGGNNGRALATLTPDAAGTAKASLVVPADATVRAGRTENFYLVTAVQPVAGAELPRTVSKVFRVTASPAQVVTEPPAPTEPSTPETVGGVPPVVQPATGGTDPAPTTGATPARSGQTAARPTAGSRPSPSAASAAPSVAAPAAAVAPAADQQPTAALPAVAPEAGLAPFAELPSTADLWSGLNAGKAPSLLDTPAARQGGGGPAGSILLGSGAALLGGVLMVAGRRRLALAPTHQR